MNQGVLRYVSGQGHASVDYKWPVGAVLGIFATFLPGLRPFLYPLLRLIALQWVADFPVLGKKNCLGKFILDLNICPSVLHRIEQGYLEGVTFILEGCFARKFPVGDLTQVKECLCFRPAYPFYRQYSKEMGFWTLVMPLATSNAFSTE